MSENDDHAPAIRWDISIGNIITLAALAVTAAIAWGTMTARSDATHNGLSTLESQQDAMEIRVRALETGQAGLAAKLDGIQSTLGRIEQFLEKRR